MVSCTVQILLWSLIAVLATILLLLIIFSAYIASVAENFVTEFNRHFEVFCENLPGITYREEVYIPLENGVYEKPLATALVDISYNVSISNCANILPLPNPPGFTNQLRIEGIEPINGDRVMFAYIFWNRRLCKAVIAFTGTEFISEWQSDIEFEQVAPTSLNGYKTGVLIHQGFYDIYIAIRDQLWNWWNNNQSWVKTLYITGHSLGGALSTICAYDFAEVFLNRDCNISNGCNSHTCTPDIPNDCNDPCISVNLPIHYSFAAPRSGNPTYAREFYKRLPTSLRIVNTEDVVPTLPPATWDRYTYEQTAGSIPFTISLGSFRDNHSQAYYYHLPECAQVAGCNVIPQNLT
jgi:hypothetical protein